jgi:hypothetical protein
MMIDANAIAMIEIEIFRGARFAPSLVFSFNSFLLLRARVSRRLWSSRSILSFSSACSSRTSGALPSALRRGETPAT